MSLYFRSSVICAPLTPPGGECILPVMTVSIRRIGRQGASLSLTIPRDMAKELALRRGDDVILLVRDETLMLRRFKPELVGLWPPTGFPESQGDK